jgi:hypothetical protein
VEDTANDKALKSQTQGCTEKNPATSRFGPRKTWKYSPPELDTETHGKVNSVMHTASTDCTPAPVVGLRVVETTGPGTDLGTFRKRPTTGEIPFKRHSGQKCRRDRTARGDVRTGDFVCYWVGWLFKALLPSGPPAKLSTAPEARVFRLTSIAKTTARGIAEALDRLYPGGSGIESLRQILFAKRLAISPWRGTASAWPV